MELAEPNPEIRAVLLSIQKQLREAASSGMKGFVNIQNVPFSDGHFWDWESPTTSYRMKLNMTGAAGKG